LAAHLPAPYKVHGRGTDQYGYIACGANYYWVPGTRRDEFIRRLLALSRKISVEPCAEP
jgi:hypothetical protein